MRALITRRTLLGGVLLASVAPLIAACGQAAPTQAPAAKPTEPPKPAEAGAPKAAEAKPTEAPKPAAAAATKPAEAPKPAEPTKPAAAAPAPAGAATATPNPLASVPIKQGKKLIEWWFGWGGMTALQALGAVA